jgi:hypothetical protein
MNHAALNQLGIILNIVAGVLLTPELIGVRRLRRFEDRLEHALKPRADRLSEVRRDLAPGRAALFVVGLAICLIATAIGVMDLGSLSDREAIGGLGILGIVALLLVDDAFVVWLGIGAVETVIRALIRSLRGQGRIVTYMTFLGVLFFLVGNAMQYIATT